jgi:hypothetical protein
VAIRNIKSDARLQATRMTKEEDSWNHSISTSSVNTSSTRYLINFQIVTLAFIPSLDIPKLNLNIINNEDNIVNYEDIASSLNILTYLIQSKILENDIKSLSSTVLLPSIPLLIVEEE